MIFSTVFFAIAIAASANAAPNTEVEKSSSVNNDHLYECNGCYDDYCWIYCDSVFPIKPWCYASPGQVIDTLRISCKTNAYCVNMPCLRCEDNCGFIHFPLPGDK